MNGRAGTVAPLVGVVVLVVLLGLAAWAAGRAAGRRAARARAAALCSRRPGDARRVGDGRRVGSRVTFPRPGRLRPATGADRLPLATELLAACLAAGATPREAAEAVGVALGGPVGDALRRAAAELRLGGDPARVWERFGRLPGAASVARRLAVAHLSGAPVARVVAAEAAAGRVRQQRSAQARARRAAVHVTGPLGLCFLPAFLLLGVAPVVLGLAREFL